MVGPKVSRLVKPAAKRAVVKKAAPKKAVVKRAVKAVGALKAAIKPRVAKPRTGIVKPAPKPEPPPKPGIYDWRSVKDIMADGGFSKYADKPLEFRNSQETVFSSWGYRTSKLDGKRFITSTALSMYGPPKYDMAGRSDRKDIVLMYVAQGWGGWNMIMSGHYTTDATEIRVNEEAEKNQSKDKYLKLKPICEILQRTRYSNTIGSDPEVFAVDGDGELMPAFDYLPTKAKAMPAGGTSYASAYIDGYQAEFSTTPNVCLSYQTDYVRQGLKKILDAAKKKNPKAELSTRTVMNVTEDRLMKDPPEYVQFGCTPSLNAYGEKPIQVDGRTVLFRSAGGHLHFTFDKKSLIPLAVKELDRILGVIAVSMFQHYDDPRRRTYYGRAGEYRTPKYGFEYRPLSNAWTFHPGIVHFMYDQARKILGVINSTGKPWTEWKTDEQEVRDCINHCNVELAQKILRENDEALSAILLSYPTQTDDADKWVTAWKAVIFDGVHKYRRKPDTYSHRWHLEDDKKWVGHSDGECGNYTRTTAHLLTEGYID